MSGRSENVVPLRSVDLEAEYEQPFAGSHYEEEVAPPEAEVASSSSDGNKRKLIFIGGAAALLAVMATVATVALMPRSHHQPLPASGAPAPTTLPDLSAPAPSAEAAPALLPPPESTAPTAAPAVANPAGGKSEAPPAAAVPTPDTKAPAATAAASSGPVDLGQPSSPPTATIQPAAGAPATTAQGADVSPAEANANQHFIDPTVWDQVVSGVHELFERVGKLEHRMDRVEHRQDDLESRVRRLERGQSGADDLTAAPGGADDRFAGRVKLYTHKLEVTPDAVDARLHFDGTEQPKFTVTRVSPNRVELRVANAVAMTNVPPAAGLVHATALTHEGGDRRYIFVTSQPVDATAAIVNGEIDLHIAKAGTAPATALRPQWQVRALTEHSAILFRPDTQTLQGVAVGSLVDGYGQVTKIDGENQVVVTTGGTISTPSPAAAQ